MKAIDRRDTVHSFKKTEEFTTYKGVSYWIYRCTSCKMEGLRLNKDSFISVSNEYDHNHTKLFCLSDLNLDRYAGLKLQIYHCYEFRTNPEYANMRPDSIHTIIKPHIIHVNGICGFWIMGATKPIKILFEECKVLVSRKRTH